MPMDDTLQLAQDTTFTEIALVIFVVVFLGIMIWVLFSRSDYFRSSARIPLDEDSIVTPRDPEPTNDPATSDAVSPQAGNNP
jgi:hypothetical protein